MALALGFGWFDRRARRGSSARMPRAPIMASRDLPPIDPSTMLSLPRSPDPLPDESLLFARSAALRAASLDSGDEDEGDAGQTATTALSILEGVDLRAMLDRVVESSRRCDSRDLAAQARARIVARLSAGKAGLGDSAPLQLVTGQQLPGGPAAGADPDDHASKIDEAMREALASALGTLRRLSDLSRA